MKKTVLKRMLSLALVLVMVVLNLPSFPVAVSAVDGMWTTYNRPSGYEDYENGEADHPPMELGYEYTDEGFKTVSCDWTGRMPYGTVQTKDPVHFEDGVYMLFSLDE